MSSMFVKGGDAERAAEYRRRADRALKHASSNVDIRIRCWFIDIANNYMTLADHVEQRMVGRSANERRRTVERRAHIEREPRASPQPSGAAK